MDSQREQDQFERMMVIQELERDWSLLHQYWEGMVHRIKRVEASHYRLGQLKERLGD